MKNRLTNAVYSIGLADGIKCAKTTALSRDGNFVIPIENHLLNYCPTFKELKQKVFENTGRKLLGKYSDWLPIWQDGMRAGYIPEWRETKDAASQ